MYGKPRFTGVNGLRYYMVKEKCGEGEDLNAEINVDLAAIPPCRCNLKEHIKRCNYQVGIWKHGLEQHPEIPTPSAGHGWTISDGMLVPLWAEEKVEEVMLPKELVDQLLDEQDSDDEDDPFMPCSEGSTSLEESDSEID